VEILGINIRYISLFLQITIRGGGRCLACPPPPPLLGHLMQKKSVKPHTRRLLQLVEAGKTAARYEHLRGVQTDEKHDATTSRPHGARPTARIATRDTFQKSESRQQAWLAFHAAGLHLQKWDWPNISFRGLY
jgi:hypothetical protein